MLRTAHQQGRVSAPLLDVMREQAERRWVDAFHTLNRADYPQAGVWLWQYSTIGHDYQAATQARELQLALGVRVATALGVIPTGDADTTAADADEVGDARAAAGLPQEVG
jgi:hypothetical protein